MFTILVLYLAVYIAFMIFQKHRIAALVCTTVLSVAYMMVMRYALDMQAYWYNTALCLPLGMWYSQFKDKIDAAVMKNNITYLVTTAVCAAVFVFAHLNKREFSVYLLWTLSFTLLVVLLAMKVTLGNKALMWLGNHVFSVYMLQRIPMIVFQNIDAVSSNRYIYFCLSFAVTIVLAELFDRGTGALDKLIFSKKAKK